MLKLNAKCNVCKQVETNPKLLKDIFNTSYFMRGSGVSLRSVWDDHRVANGAQFSYEALLNHCKKHQFLSEKDFNNRHLRQLAKTAEREMVKKKIESVEVWDKVITQGVQMLEDGSISMKTADLLKAAKDKSDFELKTKDQEMAFAEMMYFFASGENNTNLRKPYDRRIIEGETVQDNNPAAGTTADSGAGEDGPGGVYYPPAWDALTSGTS